MDVGGRGNGEGGEGGEISRLLVNQLEQELPSQQATIMEVYV